MWILSGGGVTYGCSPDLWDARYGTPVGVVVIPSGHTEDERPRFVTTFYVSDDGKIESEVTGNETLTLINSSNYTSAYTVEAIENLVPPQDNGVISVNPNTPSNPNGIHRAAMGGYESPQEIVMATDFQQLGRQNSLDPTTYWFNGFDVCIPSPYDMSVPGQKNNAFFAPMYNGYSNHLSLLDGYKITSIWATEGIVLPKKIQEISDEDGLQYYIPSLGEMAYLVARFAVIKESMDKINGVTLQPFGLPYFLTSTLPHSMYGGDALTWVFFVNQRFGFGWFGSHEGGGGVQGEKCCRPFGKVILE